MHARTLFCSFKQISEGLLCIYIRPDATCKHGTHRQATIFATLTLAHMHHGSFGVYVGNFKGAYPGTAQSAAITKTNEQAVLQQIAYV